jgi:hypothetical protein
LNYGFWYKKDFINHYNNFISSWIET